LFLDAEDIGFFELVAVVPDFVLVLDRRMIDKSEL
jgi:hypothetical protein